MELRNVVDLDVRVDAVFCEIVRTHAKTRVTNQCIEALSQSVLGTAIVCDNMADIHRALTRVALRPRQFDANLRTRFDVRALLTHHQIRLAPSMPDRYAPFSFLVDRLLCSCAEGGGQLCRDRCQTRLL